VVVVVVVVVITEAVMVVLPLPLVLIVVLLLLLVVVVVVVVTDVTPINQLFQSINTVQHLFDNKVQLIKIHIVHVHAVYTAVYKQHIINKLTSWSRNILLIVGDTILNCFNRVLCHIAEYL